MLNLYSYWRSTAAYRVRIGLNLKQVSYRQIPVHLVKEGGEQLKPEYLAKNPQGLVPTLEADGVNIGQSVAILEYLEERYPHPRLLPESLLARAQVRQLVQLVACDIHPLNNLRVLKYLKNNLNQTDDAKNQWYHHWLSEGFKAFESLANQNSGPYCMGAELSLADVCLIPQIYNAHRFGYDMNQHPRLQAIELACNELQRFKDAAPENQPDAE